MREWREQRKWDRGVIKERKCRKGKQKGARCVQMSGRRAGLICCWVQKREKQLSISLWSQEMFWHTDTSPHYCYHTTWHATTGMCMWVCRVAHKAQRVKYRSGPRGLAHATKQQLTASTIFHILFYFTPNWVPSPRRACKHFGSIRCRVGCLKTPEERQS